MTAAARRCPQCSAEINWEGNPFRPFCSERCKMIDLSHWLGERYRVPGEPLENQAESPEGEPDESD